MRFYRITVTTIGGSRAKKVYATSDTVTDEVAALPSSTRKLLALTVQPVREVDYVRATRAD